MIVGETPARLDSMAVVWRRHQVTWLVARVVAIALPFLTLSLLATGATPMRLLFAAGAVILATLATLTLPHPPRATASLIARHLDRTQPALEESATLLLDPDGARTSLERLQRARVATALGAVEPRAILPRGGWRRPAGELSAGALVALTLLVVVDRLEAPSVARPHSPSSPAIETALDPFAALAVSIEPPAYTGRSSRTQKGLELEVEQGSVVTWRLPPTNGLVVELVTGTGLVERFQHSGGHLAHSVTPVESTIYRLVAHSEDELAARTPFARLGVIADEPPRVAVVRPAARLTEVAADTSALEVETRARDDYGITGGELVVTLALGSGELVEFRERRIPLELTDSGPEATFGHRFDLHELGVGPAAELFFHVEVRDNRRPAPNVGRSPTTIVRVGGERTTTADLGAGLPIILPPTYFRSQRQIIIDTQKLIAERDALSEDQIRRRSEALGADQRALRMRYGALLGEEFVSGQAVEAGETEVGDDHAESTAEAGEAQKVDSVFDVLPEGLFHAHDSAEIATYFASETRAQLKRVLGRMWDAEGRLRVVDPEGALPFEYQALELLKELQQASRVYVQKVGFEAPPLEPDERRLAGQLDEIRSRHAELSRTPAPEVEAAARALLERLERPDDLDLPAAAAEALLLRQPIATLAGGLVEAVSALDGIEDLIELRVPNAQIRASLQQALWSLVPAPDPTPVRPIAARDPLSRHYLALRAEEGDS